MKIEKTILLSISISILLHILFFVCATGIKIHGLYTALSMSKRLFDIKLLQKEIPPAKPAKERPVTYTQVLKFKSPEYAESIKSYKEEDIKRFEMPAEEEIKKPVKISELEELSELLEGEKERKEGLQRETRKDLVEVAKVAEEEVSIRPLDSLEESLVPEDFFDKMPGFTPRKTGGILDSAKQKVLSKFAKGYTPAIKREAGFADVREYLVCLLSTYQDPVDGQKYFKITIQSGKDAVNLPRIPKEIVFLIDCSLSIQQERLEQFKEGLHYCLSHLDPDDYFNIIAFREKIIWFSPNSLKPSKENIKNALDFVGELTAGEGTDAYKALNESIKVESTVIPSYIVLFSDGRPTYGETDSRKIINEITKLNKGQRPVFAFSGGARVNRYFLDFISYKNRGWTEYASRFHLVGRHIANMYEKIKDPIFLNLRYNVSGLGKEEILPKTLPDFYRNAEFTLYGKYMDEDEFSLQLLGDSKGETSEFIVVGSFKDASKGDEEIARNWAFNKIYYLIGLLEHNHDKENKELINEINLLCNKFGIKTPYSEEIAKGTKNSKKQ